MSRRQGRQEMAVHPRTLENPERGLDLATREAGPVAAPGPETDIDEAAALRGELAALKGRIARARSAEPEPRYRHCLDCYRRGWADALEALKEGGDS